MKTSVRHLPQNKRFELNLIKQTILEFCPAIEMLILFGSYARGDWVEDTYHEGHITYEYKSDYDLLLVFGTEKEANNLALKLKLEKFIREAGTETYFSLILHSIAFVNKKIAHNNYFFADIKKEGIMLYNAGNHQLARRKKLNRHERQKHAQEDFDYWFGSAGGFFRFYEVGLKENNLNGAAFQLHQATERYYHTILLVFTGYKPKTHDIEELGRQAKNLDAEFAKVFPNNTKEEKRLFELLQKAYIDARYKPEYSIKKEELEYLGQRVELLKELTGCICREKIEGFTK